MTRAQNDSHTTEADEGPCFALDEYGEIVLREPSPRFTGLPSHGKPRTHRRNERRRKSRQLKALKTAGVLPQHANANDLEAWRQRKGATTNANMRTETKRLQSSAPYAPRSQHTLANHAMQQPTSTSDASARLSNGDGLQRVEQPQEAGEEPSSSADLQAYDQAMQQEVKLARDAGKVQRAMAELEVVERKSSKE